MTENSRITIGRAERIDLVELDVRGIPARVDTGAKTSSLWVSGVAEHDGKLSFKLFGPSSPNYDGKVITVNDFSQRIIASSNGHTELRYVVRFLVTIKGRKVRASFTLANRSRQVYPVLVGRNILAGKFIVDVKKGDPLHDIEKQRSRKLQRVAITRKELK